MGSSIAIVNFLFYIFKNFQTQTLTSSIGTSDSPGVLRARWDSSTTEKLNLDLGFIVEQLNNRSKIHHGSSRKCLATQHRQIHTRAYSLEWTDLPLGQVPHVSVQEKKYQSSTSSMEDDGTIGHNPRPVRYGALDAYLDKFIHNR